METNSTLAIGTRRTSTGRRASALALLVIVAACTRSPQATGPTVATVPSSSATAPTTPERYRFICPDAVPSDCAPARVAIDSALAALAVEFEDLGGMKLLDDADIRIALEPLPHHEPRFVIESGTDHGRYFAFVTLQAPSLLTVSGRSVVGEPFDLNYFAKNTAHELSTIFIERATRTKAAGWTLYSAPSWFVQGFEEYLGLTWSTEHARTTTMSKYVTLVRSDRTRVRTGLVVKDPYVDGAVLLRFMHRTFGKARVHAMLTNPAPTFDAAMEISLGVTKDQLLESFGKWLDGQ